MRIDSAVSLTVRNFGPFESAAVDLEAAPVHLLLGRNGAGKTSILRAIAVALGAGLEGVTKQQAPFVLGRSGGKGPPSVEFLVDTNTEAEDGQSYAECRWPSASADLAFVLDGVKTKDLEVALSPGRFLREKPESIRKLFARALGKAPDDEALRALGISNAQIREATEKRGFDSGLAKASELRRAEQRSRDAIRAALPEDVEVAICEVKFRLSTLEIEDVEAALEGLDEAISAIDDALAFDRVAEAAAGSDAGPTETDVAQAREALSEAMDRSASAREALEAAEKAESRLSYSITEAENGIAAVDREAAIFRQTGKIRCDGRFADAEEPSCPKADGLLEALAVRRSALENRALAAKQSIRALRPTIAELDDALHEADEATDQADRALERLVELREKAEARREILETAVPDERPDVDVSERAGLVEQRRTVREVAGKVRAYHEGVERSREAIERMRPIEERIAEFERFEAILEAAKAESIEAPTKALEEAVDGILGGILPKPLSIDEEGGIWYGGVPIALASKGERVVVDLALRAVFADAVGLRVLLADDLDALDASRRETVVLDLLDLLRESFALVVVAAHDVGSEPDPTLVEALPWLRRHVVEDGAVRLLDLEPGSARLGE
jgi:energy-coupling factor transporter ATP-binding protein EcfA2